MEERPGGKSRYGERLLHEINSMMFRTTVGGEIEKFRPLLRLWVGLDREHPHSFVDQLNCAQVGKYDLSGYLAYGKPILQRRNNKEYSIQKYQGEHNNEYTVMEMENGVPNGLAQLFKKGVIQMSWIMKNGVRYGSVTIYKNGVVERVTTWDSLNDAASARKDALLREVVNDVNRSGWMVEKVASTGLIVYRGGYNRADLTKEGWGFKYSKKSGLEKSYGYYRNDKLVHICQEFITGEDGTRMMIEYGGDVNDDNVSEVLNCQPIYIGGYSFNVGKGEYVRSGKGHVINESSGICDQLGEWDQEGKEMGGQQQVLHGGWYHEVDWYPSIRVNKIDFNGIINGQQYVQGNGDGDGHGDGHGDDKKDGHRKGGREGREGDFLTEGRPSIQLALSSDSILMNNYKIESFSISNNSYNGSSTDDVKMELTLSNLPQLKYVDIGANSFQRVRSLRFEHLDSLESIHIGKDCFRISAQDRWKSQRQDGLFSIQNCPKLRSVALGNNSFFDFEVFEITKVKSLRSIEFGAQCFFFGNCILQGRCQ